MIVANQLNANFISFEIYSSANYWISFVSDLSDKFDISIQLFDQLANPVDQASSVYLITMRVNIFSLCVLKNWSLLFVKGFAHLQNRNIVRYSLNLTFRLSRAHHWEEYLIPLAPHSPQNYLSLAEARKQIDRPNHFFSLVKSKSIQN